MIYLPPGLVSTKYPGYFWSIPEGKLYSIKSGVLKQIKKKRRYVDPRGIEHLPCYIVSNDGIKVRLSDIYLGKLRYPQSPEVYPIIK